MKGLYEWFITAPLSEVTAAGIAVAFVVLMLLNAGGFFDEAER